jgi:phosphoribosyl 1,2-cyclic phosphodiesterase
MIKFSVLGTGSQGNSTYIYIDGHHYLIDCGFTKPNLQKRLDTINRDVAYIEGVFVTHNHNDHQKPWMKDMIIDPGKIDSFPGIESFQLSHDTPCVGYTFTDEAGNKLGLVTDTGIVPEEAIGHLLECNALLIECNYDIELLINSPYPVERNERIASEQGHLRDECAIEVIRTVAHEGLKHLVAIHLSGNNINKDLLRFDLKSIKELPKDCAVEISGQREPLKLQVMM